MKTTRRDFLKQGGAAFGSVLLSPLTFAMDGSRGKMLKSYGFQSWTIKEALNEDPAGTCKKMAGLGYQEIEMCSPLGYSNSGFEPLNKYSGTELRKIIEDQGLKCTSSHFNLGELRDSLDDRIGWAHQMGMKQMILSSFWLPKEEQTVANYRKSAAELNRIAEKTKSAGLQMGFHNHHMEFEKRGDQLIYDALLEECDPDLVKMQFQVAVVNIGYHAAEYFRKHPGRFISAHLADWSKAKETQVPIGQGVVDWQDFCEAAKIGGVKNVYVEMSPETFKDSAEFLSML
ncbi:MAG: sugar phosphate isomerase/epimerase [Phycisphaeraceae bacterium]|nr:sugar phosphate isomerase/epimerase [Phycisphaeraceae bacterium]